jgi:hypothetical protein
MKKLIIFLSLILVSCSPYERLNKIIKNNPNLIDSFITVKYEERVDTIIRTVQIPVPEYKDSFILIHDTTIRTERLYITKKGDKIYIRIPADTLQKIDTLYVPVQITNVTKKNPWIDNIPLPLLLIAFIISMLFIRKKKS